MKVLKIKVSGFKLLKDNFEINFLTKARVNKEDLFDEVVELYENLYMPTTTVLLGGNASGKSSLLYLIDIVNSLIFKGRLSYNPLYFRSEEIEIEFWFFYKEYIYHYKGTLSKPAKNIIGEKKYCNIKEESLRKRKYYKSYGNRVLDSQLAYEKVEEFESKIDDTSGLKNVVKEVFPILIGNTSKSLISTFELYNILGLKPEVILKVLRLFDDCIKDFYYDDDKELFYLDIADIGPKTYTEKDITRILSSGTYKGFSLFIIIITVLMFGTTLIVDELENSFHKNLVENVIYLFEDKRINKQNATLIFSTHYVETIDILRRVDSIFIVSKKDQRVNVENLYETGKLRTDLSKSNAFNQNVFNTLINYDRLMDLKEELERELSSHS